MLIVLEGIDKSGKGTQAALLRDALLVAGKTPLLFSFPRYMTPIGKMIRSHLKNHWSVQGQVGPTDLREIDAMAFQALMLADKCLAAPLINEQEVLKGTTICDRYWQSAYAYGSADGLDSTTLIEMHQVLPVPHVNILIDTPVDVAMNRGREGRPDDPDRYERDRSKLERVRENYLALWRDMQQGRWGWDVVDGTAPLLTVHETILAAVRR